MAELAQPAATTGARTCSASTSTSRAPLTPTHWSVAWISWPPGACTNPGTGVRGELFRRTHLEEVGRARSVREPGVGLGGSNEFHTVYAGELARARLDLGSIGAGGDLVAVAPARPMLEREPGEEPPLRAVLQGIDRVGDTEIDQRLRADDGRVRPAQLTTILVFGSGTMSRMRSASSPFAADAAGDIHLAVFGERAAVDDDEILAASRMAWMACAVTRGVCFACSTSSPKVLLGTLTPA